MMLNVPASTGGPAEDGAPSSVRGVRSTYCSSDRRLKMSGTQPVAATARRASVTQRVGLITDGRPDDFLWRLAPREDTAGVTIEAFGEARKILGRFGEILQQDIDAVPLAKGTAQLRHHRARLAQGRERLTLGVAETR